MNSSNHFSGSYPAADVEFLLTPISIADTPIEIKETLIQSGQKHYSQLLSHEALPGVAYEQLFYQALAANKQRLAEQVWLLCQQIIATRDYGITLVSLARAGTPIGVLIKRVLKKHFGVECKHYSISIVRDLGLDSHALRTILQRHSEQSLVFIDGWTGKGVIANQLAGSLKAFADTDGVQIPADLYVLADLSGYAAHAASYEDYLIPSCLLNATVSGLVSRSIYQVEQSKQPGFHGCVYYQQFAKQDLSNYFIETVLSCLAELAPTLAKQTSPCAKPDKFQLQNQMQQMLDKLSERYKVSHVNYIKPGIGEATRVLLRREAKLLLLQQAHSDETRHLRWLAETKAITIEIVNYLPVKAVALIKEMNV